MADDSVSAGLEELRSEVESARARLNPDTISTWTEFIDKLKYSLENAESKFKMSRDRSERKYRK